MKKSELYEGITKDISELLEGTKISKATKSELFAIVDNYLKPKSGGSSAHPPILDEDGNIVEAWCRFHERYEVVEDMVISNGKSKGYCKAGISHWNKNQSAIKKLESEAIGALTKGDFDAAKDFSEKAKELKDTLDYDYERYWEAFRPAKG